MEWAQILVIMLSVFLAVFLLLGIVLTILLIRVTKQIKEVTDSAQRTASGIEGVVSNFSKLSSPAFLVRMVSKQLKRKRKQK